MEGCFMVPWGALFLSGGGGSMGGASVLVGEVEKNRNDVFPHYGKP